MRAVTYARLGDRSVLELVERPVPEPGALGGRDGAGRRGGGAVANVAVELAWWVGAEGIATVRGAATARLATAAGKVLIMGP